jgi:hypothetical protein
MNAVNEGRKKHPRNVLNAFMRDHSFSLFGERSIQHKYSRESLKKSDKSTEPQQNAVDKVKKIIHSSFLTEDDQVKTQQWSFISRKCSLYVSGDLSEVLQELVKCFVLFEPSMKWKSKITLS